MVMYEMGGMEALGGMMGISEAPPYMTQTEYRQSAAETFGHNVGSAAAFGGLFATTGFAMAGLGMAMPMTGVGKNAFRFGRYTLMGAKGQLAETGLKSWVYTSARAGSYAEKAGALAARMGLSRTAGITAAAVVPGVAAATGALMAMSAPIMAADWFVSKAADVAKDRAEIQDYIQASSFRYAPPSEWSPDDVFGGGFGRKAAGRIAEGIQSYEAQNPMYDMGELKGILMKGTQIGLFQGTKDAEDFQKKFKETADALKVVTKILHTSLGEGLDAIKAMRDVGVTTEVGQKAMIGRADIMGLASGKTAAEMFTIGLQGAQVFRGTGVSMESGSQANQVAFAQLTNMQRNGLITAEQMSHMGGQEAFAQSMTMGALNFAQTPYGRGLLMSIAPTGTLDADKLEALMSGKLNITEAYREAGNAMRDPGNFMKFQNNQEKILGDLMKSMGGMGGTLLPLTGTLVQAQQILKGMNRPLTQENQEEMTRFLMRTQLGYSAAQADASINMLNNPESFQKEMTASLQQNTTKMAQEAIAERYGIYNNITRGYRSFIEEYPGALGRNVGRFADDVSTFMTRWYNTRVLGMSPVGTLKMSEEAIVPTRLQETAGGTPVGTPADNAPASGDPGTSRASGDPDNVTTSTINQGDTAKVEAKKAFQVVDIAKDVRLRESRDVNFFGRMAGMGTLGLAVGAAAVIASGGTLLPLIGAAALGAAVGTGAGFGSATYSHVKGMRSLGDLYRRYANNDEILTAPVEGATQISDKEWLAPETADRIKASFDKGLVISESDLQDQNLTQRFIESPERVAALRAQAGREMTEKMRVDIALAKFDPALLSPELQKQYKEMTGRGPMSPETTRAAQKAILSQVTGLKDLSKEGQMLTAETYMQTGRSEDIKNMIYHQSVVKGTDARELGQVQDVGRRAEAAVEGKVHDVISAAIGFNPQKAQELPKKDAGFLDIIANAFVGIGTSGMGTVDQMASASYLEENKLVKSLSENKEVQSVMQELSLKKDKLTTEESNAFKARLGKQVGIAAESLQIKTDPKKMEETVSKIFTMATSDKEVAKDLAVNTEKIAQAKALEKQLSADILDKAQNKAVWDSLMLSEEIDTKERDTYLAASDALLRTAAFEIGTMQAGGEGGTITKERLGTMGKQAKEAREILQQDKALAKTNIMSVKTYEAVEQLADIKDANKVSASDKKMFSNLSGFSAEKIDEYLKTEEGRGKIASASLLKVAGASTGAVAGALETTAQGAHSGLPEVAAAMKIIREQTQAVAEILAAIKGLQLNIKAQTVTSGGTGGGPGAISYTGGSSFSGR
jgi:hypothetical protein